MFFMFAAFFSFANFRPSAQGQRIIIYTATGLCGLEREQE